MREMGMGMGVEHTVSNDGHVTDVGRLVHQATDLLKSEAGVMLVGKFIKILTLHIFFR